MIREWLFGTDENDEPDTVWVEKEYTVTRAVKQWRIEYVDGERRELWAMKKEGRDEYRFYTIDPNPHGRIRHGNPRINIRFRGDELFTAVKANVKYVEPIDRAEWTFEWKYDSLCVDGDESKPTGRFRTGNDVEVESP